MQKTIAFITAFFLFSLAYGQNPSEKAWVDSVYNSLTPRERIGQLVVMRLSSIDSKTRTVRFYDSLVSECIKKYNIGGLCLFQGSPAIQAEMVNHLRRESKTPLLISIDGEWGLGMRMTDSVESLPRQMMLGAIRDTHVIYAYARVIADQCRRFGIHIDFAPVIDINNNPLNPVINDRSFGEDKERVALLGRQYVNGLEQAGVMACVKHFPGHGDVSTDSHYDLPVINKTKQQLDSLELYPFRSLFASGVSSAMVGHLFIPSIDSAVNRATSLSAKNVTGLLRDELGFQGLSFTDALEMEGVKKFFPFGKSGLEALRAGNDMLLLPDNVPATIDTILEAVAKGLLSTEVIEAHCKKVLSYKFRHGVHLTPPVDTKDLTATLNQSIPAMKRLIAENALTLAMAENRFFFPFKAGEIKKGELAYVNIGLKRENQFGTAIIKEYPADSFYFPIAGDSTLSTDSLLKKLESYRNIIVSIHPVSRRPANNFGISVQAASLMKALAMQHKVLVVHFGNPYAAVNLCQARNLVIAYEDDPVIQQTAAEALSGRLPYRGQLPVTICDNLRAGHSNWEAGREGELPGIRLIDSIMYDGIRQKAMPGGVVLVARQGKILHHKGYGSMEYDYTEPVTTKSIYDAASVTKVCATTLAIMKLFEEHKIKLNKKISSYLPALKGKAAGRITVEKLLLHEGGLPPTLSLHKLAIDSSGKPLPEMFAADSGEAYPIRVSNHVYAGKKWNDEALTRIAGIIPSKEKKYVYSDIDFILLGKIVEQITGEPLDDYVSRVFYCPLGLSTIGYKPYQRMPVKSIAPSEQEQGFRQQLIRGDVHDPTAAMMGGVAGHAGIFSNAYDLFVIMQMLLNGGEFGGTRYFKRQTIMLFTGYGSEKSRRGLGFDKPEKDNRSRPQPYPALDASILAFGHLGFTGTCVWADPAYHQVYILLSNRVYPSADDRFVKMNIRSKVLDAIYRSYWIY